MKIFTTVAVLALVPSAAFAQGRTYAEPYPYHKSSGAQGYQIYPVHGCNDYEITGSGPVRHICDRRSPAQILKTTDREGQGVAATE